MMVKLEARFHLAERPDALACCGLRPKATSARENKWSERGMFNFTDALVIFPLFLVFMATVACR